MMVTKTDWMMVCREHLPPQFIILEDFDCIHNKTYFTVNFNEKKRLSAQKVSRNVTRNSINIYLMFFRLKKWLRKNMFAIVFLISICELSISKKILKLLIIDV